MIDVVTLPRRTWPDQAVYDQSPAQASRAAKSRFEDFDFQRFAAKQALQRADLHVVALAGGRRVCLPRPDVVVFGAHGKDFWLFSV
jgi:4'-phosphopantetheinyl transferase EntD